MNKAPLDIDLKSYLERTAPKCPKCDYELKGLPGDRCPECGTLLTVEMLVNHRLHSPVHIGAGLGFLVSAIILCGTCYLSPIGFLYLAFFIWWGTAPQWVSLLSPNARQWSIVLAWFPAVLIVGGFILLTQFSWLF